VGWGVFLSKMAYNTRKLRDFDLSKFPALTKFFNMVLKPTMVSRLVRNIMSVFATE
jgi:hypothetical protein